MKTANENRALHALQSTVEKLAKLYGRKIVTACQRPEEALIRASVKYLPAAMTSGA